MGPMTVLTLTLVVFLLLIIGAQGSRMTLLVKMGLRNVNRRKVNTLIVVFGLMIGTAIISGSLVVGDTLEHMFTKGVYDSLDETDEIIFTYDADGRFGFFDYSEYTDLRHHIEADGDLSRDVQGLSPEIHIGISAFNTDTRLSQPGVMLMGFSYSESEVFGALTTLDGTTVTEEDLGPDEIFLNQLLAEDIEAEAGHRIMLFIRDQPRLFTVRAVVKDQGRAAYGQLYGPAGAMGGMNVFMPLSRVQSLTNETGKINLIKVSNTGGVRGGIQRSDAVEEELTPVLYSRDPILFLFKIKQQYIEDAERGSDSLRDLFMVLGLFCIIAGMMLIINIFVMLAEERKSEMGMARAVGMSQKHLRYTFLFEGTFYSVLSSLVGTVVGLGVAFGIILAFGAIFGGFNSLQFFTFSHESILLAFAAGVLVTLVTILYASWKVSRINIIRAIRNIPEPRYTRHTVSEPRPGMNALQRTTALITDQLKLNYEVVIMALSALLVFASFVDIGLFHNREWAGYGGLSTFIYGTGLLLRRYITDERAFTLAGGAVLLLWAYPYDIYDQLFGVDMAGDMEMFLLSGLFMVSSALLVVMNNSNLILSGLLRIFGRFEGLAPIFKTAVSYPMNNRFRTGMTLAMFSLIIFTITVLAMIMGLIGGNMDTITQENSGGYDMIVTTDPNRPIPGGIGQAIENSDNLSRDDFHRIVPLHTLYGSMDRVRLHRDPERMQRETDSLMERPFAEYQANGTWYTLIGCTDAFFEHSDFPLDAWDRTQYADDREVWKALSQNSSLVILDMFLMERQEEGGGPPIDHDLRLAVGDMLVVRTNASGGHERAFKVIGFTKSFLLSGAFVHADALTGSDGFNTTTSSLTLISFDKAISESEQEEIAKDMEREFLQNGMQTRIIRKEVEGFVYMMNNFFYLLQAFLGLGLAVGIAGLGIITIRSVTERKQQIGMLRAIGFKRSMIWHSFLIESSYIAILGIVIGVGLGIILGLRFWLDPESGFTGGFIIPWRTIIPVSLISYLITLVCTIGPSRGAARIMPAEALRYVG